MINTALENYLGKNGKTRKNCAQAVLCGFKEVLNISDETITEFGAFGTGRAPENLCGAIYAAEMVLAQHSDQKTVQQLRDYFVENAGSDKCRDIRGHKKMSCVGCVENAVKFVSNQLFGEAETCQTDLAL